MRLIQGVFGLVAGLSLIPQALSAPVQDDPCAKIAGKPYVPPAQALACYRAFPFNETLRQNVLTNIAGVFNFFTFEDYYLNSPSPFQESTVDIRATLARINSTEYETDYDFNKDVYDFTMRLNDGHTRYIPSCYTAFQSVLPAPIISLHDPETDENAIYIAPDSAELISLLSTNYTDYYASIGFDWKRLAGAKVLSIGGMDPYEYVDKIASTISGNYLDHGIRVNLVYTSYRIVGADWSQRVGDLSGPIDLTQDGLTFTLTPVGSNEPETVTIPYLASLLGLAFTDKDSYWAANCAANSNTNGVDLKALYPSGRRPEKRQPQASVLDLSQKNALALPEPYLPTVPLEEGSTGVIKTYILPDKKTGVMYVGSFTGDFYQFQLDVYLAVNALKKGGATQLLVELSNNGGGYVCLGHFLHAYLAADVGYTGFTSTNRASPLAQNIVASGIKLGLDASWSYYAADNWAFLNDTHMPRTYNYLDPTLPLVVNNKTGSTSQRLHDFCSASFIINIPEEPPFELSKVALVGNGACASTCALFTTVMSEKYKTKIAVFGGKPGEPIEYKGMAGNQVMEWWDIDTEIKTAGLKGDPAAPPDLLVKANFRHNWRTAWSLLDENEPIAYRSDSAAYRFPYTKDTYNHPQNLWTFAAAKLFGPEV